MHLWSGPILSLRSSAWLKSMRSAVVCWGSLLWRMRYYSHVVHSCTRWKWGHNLELSNSQSKTKRACFTAGGCMGQQPVKGVVAYLVTSSDRAWLYRRQQQGGCTAADARKRDRVTFYITQGLGMTSEQSGAGH